MSAPEPLVNPPTPADPPQPNPENTSTIQAMRAKIDEANRLAKEKEQEAATLKAQLDEIEKAKLSEIERLKLERDEASQKLSELDRIRDENGRYTSTFEKLYQDTLQTVPEDKRADIETLTAQGTWADRYTAIQAAVKLLPPQGVSVPRIQPGHPGPVNDPVVTPPTKSNADVAKTGGVRGFDLTQVQYRKPTGNTPSA